MPPISIDGVDVTAISVDADDISEITADGDIVWTAGSAIPDPPDNLDVRYALTDGDFLDDSGNNNDATASGSYTFVSDGVQFDSGDGNYAESPDIGLNGDDTATIGTYIIPDQNFDSGTAGQYWVGIHHGNNAWALGYEAGDIVIHAISTASTADTLRYTTNLEQGTQYAVWARSDNGAWSIWLNGQSVASKSTSTGPSVANSGAFKLSRPQSSLLSSGTTATLAESWAADRAVSDSELSG